MLEKHTELLLYKIKLSPLSICNVLLISAPRLGVYYFCRWFCLSVYSSDCLFVTLLLQIDSSFSFLDGIEPYFGRHLSTALYKTSFFDFWFRPPNAKNLLPKICSCTKSPISRLVWQIDRRCLGLVGVFGMANSIWNHAKCCGADHCCRSNDIWPRRRDLVVYRLVMFFFELCLLFSVLFQFLIFLLPLMVNKCIKLNKCYCS